MITSEIVKLIQKPFRILKKYRKMSRDLLIQKTRGPVKNTVYTAVHLHLCLSFSLHMSLSVSLHFHLFLCSSLFLSLFFFSLALSSLSSKLSFLNSLTIFTRSVGSLSLCTQKSDLPHVPECTGLGSFPGWRRKFASRRKNLYWCSVAVCCGVCVVVYCGVVVVWSAATLVTSVVYPRVFEILTTLTLGALRKKSHCVTNIRGHHKKQNKTTCGQQCIMTCQEHNRSKKGTLREKKIRIRRP